MYIDLYAYVLKIMMALIHMHVVPGHDRVGQFFRHLVAAAAVSASQVRHMRQPLISSRTFVYPMVTDGFTSDTFPRSLSDHFKAA